MCADKYACHLDALQLDVVAPAAAMEGGQEGGMRVMASLKSGDTCGEAVLLVSSRGSCMGPCLLALTLLRRHQGTKLSSLAP